MEEGKEEVARGEERGREMEQRKREEGRGKTDPLNDKVIHCATSICCGGRYERCNDVLHPHASSI